jgi:hypothetical protein
MSMKNRQSVIESLEPRRLLSAPNSFISGLTTAHSITESTVPANGDLNPYGIAFVPQAFPSGGSLKPGNLLVSNFNASSNLQGTGTTIIRVKQNGATSVFYQGPSGEGLSTALDVLSNGFVVVGNLPSTDGTSATAQAGSLIVLNRSGQLVTSLTSPTLLDGPWDMAVNDEGKNDQLFVANVLSGTITRVDIKRTGSDSIKVKDMIQIASGYQHRGDPNAFEIGPTGLVYDAALDKLFVASTGDNEIFSVPNASVTTQDNGTGKVIFSDSTKLHGPLGMVLAPNGHLVIANGDAIDPDAAQPSELVEINPKGKFIGEFSTDSAEGANFGIAVSDDTGATLFGAVNDDDNTVTEWTLS